MIWKCCYSFLWWGNFHGLTAGNRFTVTHFILLTDVVSTVREILRRGMSVNLYMFHGGSSFGFMAGALSEPSYRALVTSYGWFLHRLCSNTNMWNYTNQKPAPCRMYPDVSINHVSSSVFSDYDAPLSEAGEYTQKYHLLRDLFSRIKSKPGTKVSK